MGQLINLVDNHSFIAFLIQPAYYVIAELLGGEGTDPGPETGRGRVTPCLLFRNGDILPKKTDPTHEWKSFQKEILIRIFLRWLISTMLIGNLNR